MKLREKFMTVCQGCDGTSEYEEPIGGFENSVTYKLTKCDCENGKELDWEKVEAEIKDVKLKIKEYQELVESRLEFARESHAKNEVVKVFNLIGLMIEYENKVTELENYLAELEVIE
jgi:hypothetical protein